MCSPVYCVSIRYFSRRPGYVYPGLADASHEDHRTHPLDSDYAASHEDHRTHPLDSEYAFDDKLLSPLGLRYRYTRLNYKAKMACCIGCNTALNLEVDSIDSHYYYRILDMGPELLELVEQRFGDEIVDNSYLCNSCFNNITQALGDNGDHHTEMINRCLWCERSLRTVRQTHILIEGPIYNEIAMRISPREIPENGSICHACWVSARRNIQRQNDIDQQRPTQQRPIQLGDYYRTPNNSAHCFIRGCINRDRHIVPLPLKRRLLSEFNLYVTPAAKICMDHLQYYDWNLLNQSDYIINFNENEMIDMLNILSTKENSDKLNFEDLNSLTDSHIQYWLGLPREKFLNFLDQVPELRQQFKNPKTILAVYLVKLRTGEPNNRQGELFGCSEKKVRRLLKTARDYLNQYFVPSHLGISHLSREELIQRNLLIPQGLFGDSENRKAIIICDGTYIYLQKSSNYFFQKKTYSLHKYRNLAKPFLIVATDGHIIDVFGPYAATRSDADIIKDLFREDSELTQYFQSGDVFILDRGFRDAIGHLRALDYVIHKPESLEEGQLQLSTIKANKSRCVTLCRWVVEVVNGRFKRDFKLFRNTYFNTSATHLKVDLRIAAAIINAYHPVLENRPDASLILDRALQRINIENDLGQYIIRHNINRRRASFIRIDANVPALDIFPIMSMSDLVLFALGIYQIKQARSYYGEHIRQDGTFYVEVANVTEQAHVNTNEAQQLIRGRIRSRHQGHKIYYCYILLNPSENNWEQKIAGYYCNCLVGMRTVGCCAHVMTLVWYLGWARHQNNIEAPASFLDNILIRDEENTE